MKTIELNISPAGQVRLETCGFAGGECLQSAAFLRQTLGQVTHEARTPEFYVTTTAASRHAAVTPPQS